MNFYQRANLTFGLAVIIGFEFTVTNSSLITPSGLELDWQACIWIVFQFMFRAKITIDDHSFFADKNIANFKDKRMLVDFLLFSGANLFFVLAAVTSLNPPVSYCAFLLALFFATIWAYFHSRKQTDEIYPVWQWIGINIVYAIFLLWRLYGDIDLILPSIALWMAMFIFLFLDFWVSKTSERMPNGASKPLNCPHCKKSF
ncbi:hypothetical protein [Colwellia sp. Bg11-28]|uniref:hypothetical protein n=1 Tax=Colwellia sp. Bg11-28 TaxID=2058305 RepID=UPI000C31F931|nr:hypothetical protein [Colwellia sp. Bg11-28]PKH88327.1 hypothetical protein CXF79_06070 [Colwellia sp. Bg11-28]